MPSLRSDEFHMTFTDSGGLSIDQIDSIRLYLEKHTLFTYAVLEDANGGNKHIHAWVKYSKPKVASNLRNSPKILHIYHTRPTPIQLRINKVDNRMLLLGYYLQKEGPNVIYERLPDDINLQAYISEASQVMQDKKINSNRLHLSTAHHTIYKFSISHKSPIMDKHDFVNTLCLMAKEGYPVHTLAGKYLWLYCIYKTCYLDDSSDLANRIYNDMRITLSKECIEAPIEGLLSDI